MWLKKQCNHAHTIAIIGMSKNAGKTTVMNTLLKAYFGCKVAITSIGLDGENQDTLSFKEKPKIHVFKGMLVATATDTLKESTASVKIIERTAIMTPLGEIIIGEIMKAGTILLAGPSTNGGLLEIKHLFEKLAVEKIFIDGALFRKSFAKQHLVDGVILVSGAVYSKDLGKIVDDTKTIIDQLTLKDIAVPKLPDNLKCALFNEGDEVIWGTDLSLSLDPTQIHQFMDEEFVRIQITGALTDSMVPILLKHREKLVGKTLIIDDAANILCSSQNYRYLEQVGLKLLTRHPVEILFVGINPFSPSGYAFDPFTMKQKMTQALNCPIINVKTDLELIL